MKEDEEGEDVDEDEDEEAEEEPGNWRKRQPRQETWTCESMFSFSASCVSKGIGEKRKYVVSYCLLFPFHCHYYASVGFISV